MYEVGYEGLLRKGPWDFVLPVARNKLNNRTSVNAGKSVADGLSNNENAAKLQKSP